LNLLQPREEEMLQGVASILQQEEQVASS
jgi:hypothetical protein